MEFPVKRIPCLSVVMFVAALLWAPESHAQKISLIRDAEIENTIRLYSAPLFEAAGLDPSSINIYLVNDKSLNAFVASGQNLFLNTGLLLRAGNVSQVIGVIAHETGHIAGGHLSRVNDAIADAGAQTILGLVLGTAAAIGTGRADLGAAIAFGATEAGLRSFLKYSRTQESAADQAALRVLDETGQSSRGLQEFLELLNENELLSYRHQGPYVRTHPLSRDRIEAIADHISRSPYSDTPSPEKVIKSYSILKAKLGAFIEPTTATLALYKETDASIEARYARAIAYYRLPDMKRALPIIDGLIAEYPGNPYFLELKGQMLFENGRVKESLQSYQASVRIIPDQPLLLRALARVQIELNDPAYLDRAILNLRAALHREPKSPSSWRDLAIAYGRLGRMGQSSLALAEEALLKHDLGAAAFYASRAETMLAEGTPGWLQSQDILHATKKAKKKKDE
jgi:predicted Zn-dependent protease